MSVARSKKIALAITLCSILSGCGGPQVDSRNIDWNNGLAYKHGSDEPFTGTIVYTDSIPDELDRYWDSNAMESSRNVITGCKEHYKDGLIDGEATCDGVSGQAVLVLTFKDERYDGVSKLFDPHTGKLFKLLPWDQGKLNGEAKVYSYDDDARMMQDVNFKDGTYDGEFREWDKNGTLITDATYQSGNVISGKVTDKKGVVTYKNGKLDGEAEYFGVGAFNTGIASKGEYKDGLRVGEWIDGPGTMEEVGHALESAADPLFPGKPYPTVDLPSVNSVLLSKIVSTWVGGQLDGPVKGYQKGGALAFSATVKSGKIDGVYTYIPLGQPNRGKEEIEFRNGILAGCVGDVMRGPSTVYNPNGYPGVDALEASQDVCQREQSLQKSTQVGASGA